jgi:DNA-binding PadR family transcriptional regulator
MSAKKHKDFELGLLQMQILWLLGREPSHGYELMKRLDQIKSSKVEQGTLYPALQKLEENDLIQVKEIGERGKKIYELTEDGKKMMIKTCEEFSKTFSGIFMDFVCKSCKTEVKR